MPRLEPFSKADKADPKLREHRQSSEKLLSGRFLQVFSDMVALPDGNSAFREYIVHPGAVMIIPLLSDDAAQMQVILERQFRYPVDKVMVELPAGKRDGSEDLLACAQRELREETGYTATEWAHAGIMHPCISYSTEYIDVWFARGLHAGTSKLDPGEFLEVFSAPVDDFLNWCRLGQVSDGKTLTGAFWLQNFVLGKLQLDWQAAP